jgi:hypothetical protein
VNDGERGKENKKRNSVQHEDTAFVCREEQRRTLDGVDGEVGFSHRGGIRNGSSASRPPTAATAGLSRVAVDAACPVAAEPTRGSVSVLKKGRETGGRAGGGGGRRRENRGRKGQEMDEERT